MKLFNKLSLYKYIKFKFKKNVLKVHRLKRILKPTIRVLTYANKELKLPQNFLSKIF